jgi:hypothetical protein
MANPLSSSRFFGGHYDSVKQAAIFETARRVSTIEEKDKEAAKIMQQMYTARMRLDILLNGKIVVTDSQYYDGAFFHALFHTDFFPVLSKLSKEYRMFEVKRRGSGLVGMIQKPFIFSALPDDNIKSQVRQTIKEELSRGMQIDTIENARKVYVDGMDSAIRNKCQEIFEHIVQMDMETPAWVFDPWITTTFKENLNEALGSIHFKFPEGETEEAKTKIQFIRRDLEKGPYDRSGVWEEVKNYLLQKSVEQHKNDSVSQTWAWYQKVYNRAIALQHGCTSQDLGENMVYGITDTQADDQDREKILKSISKDIVFRLPINLTQEIAKENWSDFIIRLNKEPLLGLWKEYMKARMEVIGLPDGPKKFLRLFGPLDILVGYLRTEYGSTTGYSTWEIEKKAAMLTAKTLGTLILAGGSLADIPTAFGLVIGSATVLLDAGKLVKTALGNPLEYLNMVKIGLESTHLGD